MRELVRAIDSHVETVDLEITSNLNAAKDAQAQHPPADQPTEDASEQQVEDVDQLSPTDPSV